MTVIYDYIKSLGESGSLVSFRKSEVKIFVDKYRRLVHQELYSKKVGFESLNPPKKYPIPDSIINKLSKDDKKDFFENEIYLIFDQNGNFSFKGKRVKYINLFNC